jgi:hypothetical protein
MDFSELRNRGMPPDFLRLADHFERLSVGRLMPQQDEFRPNDIRWLLGRVYLTDVLDGGSDFRVRLFGTFWQMLGGEDLTGRRFSELEAQSDRLNHLRPAFDAVVSARRPIYSVGKLKWPNSEPVFYHRLAIPFTQDGETVSQVLVAADYDHAAQDMIIYKGAGSPVVMPD